ncbi:uncharacterized protein [Amphiura filiformis]|uniref:uncharacterized protein n=1 Tax=Amphiura filiformis TaxID=82378 RepID=UPI003B212011
MNPGRGKPTFDVYVGNLPSTADEDGMKRLFASYGGIHSVLLKDGKQTGTKFGFVRFVEEESAQKAVSDASGKYVNGKVLLVKKAERNPNNPKYTGGGGGGGGSGGGGSGFGGTGGSGGGFGGGGDAGKDGTSARTRGVRQDSPATAAPQNLTVVAEESVMLTHASNACSVYVQLSSQASIEQSSRIMVEMQEFCQSAPKISSKPEPKVLYGSVFSEDGLWYRCKVLAYGQNNTKEAHVRYIDYGNEEVTDATQMVQLTGELATVQPQACKLHLHGLKPTCTAISNAEEHKRAVNFLMGVADNKFINVRLYKPLVHGDQSVPCELHCEGQDLNRLMRDHGFAAPITPVASPSRGPDQSPKQSSSQNGFSSNQQQAPRQQRQIQQQNRQEDAAAGKQGTTSNNRQQGANRAPTSRNEQGGNRAPTSRNEQGANSAPPSNKQLENATREIKKKDRQLSALKTENEGLQSLLSSAVQVKFTKVQKSFEKVRTLRKEMPLDVTVDGVIETAIKLLQNTETSISKKVLDARR